MSFFTMGLGGLWGGVGLFVRDGREGGVSLEGVEGVSRVGREVGREGAGDLVRAGRLGEGSDVKDTGLFDLIGC